MAEPPETVGLVPSSTPSVTVVVATHNHGTSIGRCLEGIAAQRFSQPFRCIVYDDASTDDTVQVVRSYVGEYPELFQLVLSRDHQVGRIATGWLEPLLRPTSEYVALCEGDDCWLDERKLESQWQFMNRHPWCAVSHHDVEIEARGDTGGRPGELAQRLSTERPADERVPGAELVRGTSILTSTTMLRSSCIPDGLSDIRGTRMPLDRLILSLVATSGDVGYIPIPMARYRARSDDLWTAMTLAERQSREAETLWFLAAHSEGRARDVCRQRLAAIESLGWSDAQP